MTSQREDSATSLPAVARPSFVSNSSRDSHEPRGRSMKAAAPLVFSLAAWDSVTTFLRPPPFSRGVGLFITRGLGAATWRTKFAGKAQQSTTSVDATKDERHRFLCRSVLLCRYASFH